MLFLFPSTAFVQNCAIRLSGHVEDADTKDKLREAVVIIKESGLKVVTNEKGDFVFEGLCPGEYTLVVSHESCGTIERKFTLQKNLHTDILLPHARQTLGEVVLGAKTGITNTGFKKELTERNLEQTRGQSLAEALSKINGVTMLQTGSTIAKPVIHGLHGSRILTINNGVRQEGQQWGNEHAPEIDPFIADKLIVIKGVDELKYGSDAIAGVILVEPKPLRSLPGYAAEINTAYFTNNRQYVVSGMWEEQLKKQPAFRYRIQATYKQGANATTPDYRLNNTGSKEQNFSVAAGWKKSGINTELFYSQFNTTIGIFTGSHIGNITDLQNAIASPRPNPVFTGEQTYRIGRPSQEVQHRLVKLKSVIDRGAHRFNILLSGQFNRRKEFDIVRSATTTRPQLDLTINTFAQDLSWEHPRYKGFKGIAGIALMQQDNSYTGRYFIPNYTSYTFGGYLIEKWSRHHWELQAGLRYDNKTINTTRLKFNGDTINYDFNFSTFAASFNTIYKPSDAWHFNFNISLASRAPYVNELLSDGIHHGTATYEKGDINLQTEKSVNLAVGSQYQNEAKTFRADLLLYVNTIRDFIYQQPRPDAPVLTIAGAFPQIAFTQTDARLSGFDLTTVFSPDRRFDWQAKFSVLQARNTTLDDWLILMPANRMSHELTYNFKETKRYRDTYLSVEWMAVERQKRTPDDANGKQDYKEPPAGYQLLHLQAATTIRVGKAPVTVGLGVRNLLNTAYRDYLNAMRYFTDEMGRNISVRIKVPISSNY